MATRRNRVTKEAAARMMPEDVKFFIPTIVHEVR
jgi:hypothetical protein